MAVPRMSNLIASRNWSQALTASRQSSNKDDRSSKVDVKVSITFSIHTTLNNIDNRYLLISWCDLKDDLQSMQEMF